MQRYLSSFSLFIALALHSAVGHGAPQADDSGPAPDMQVNGKADPCVRLRSGASLSRRIVGCLEPGTRLSAQGGISGWSHVRLPDGTEGWVDSSYLEPLATLPAGQPTAALQAPAEPPADVLDQIAALEGQLEAAAVRREATEERLRKTVVAAEAAQRDAGQLRQRVEQLESAAAQGNRAEQIETELATTRARVKELEGNLAAAEERVLRAAQLNAEQERRIEMLDASVAASRAGEADRQQALAAAEEREQDTERASTSQTKRIEELTAKLADAEFRLADAELRIAEAELEARLASRPEPAPERPTESLVKVRAPVVSEPKPAKVPVRTPAAVTEETAPPVATPTEVPAPATDAAINAVRAWAAAWADQRVDDYLSFYAPGFRPPNGLSRGEWERQRQQRLSGPSHIRVTISSLHTELAGDGTVRATFGQDYESDTFADSVNKVLTLAAEDGTWRILEERVTP